MDLKGGGESEAGGSGKKKEGRGRERSDDGWLRGIGLSSRGPRLGRAGQDRSRKPQGRGETRCLVATPRRRSGGGRARPWAAHGRQKRESYPEDRERRRAPASGTRRRRDQAPLCLFSSHRPRARELGQPVPRITRHRQEPFGSCLPDACPGRGAGSGGTAGRPRKPASRASGPARRLFLNRRPSPEPSLVPHPNIAIP